MFTSKIDFDREKWNLNRLAECVAQHKHIVLPLATVTVGNQFNILFPLAQMDLEKFLQGHLRHPEMCEMNDIIDEAINVVDALDHLHDRLGVSIHGYHMDLKPANILVYEDSGHREQSGVGSWKITDFGLSIIARAGRRGSADGLPQDRVTETRTHLLRREGTYQAPEVCSGPGPCRRSDIWSFGCILVRVLAFKLDGIDGLRALDDLRRLDNDGIGYYEDDHFTRGNPPVLNPHIENWITGLAQGNRQGYPDEFLHGCAKMLLSILQTDKNARPLARDVKEELGSLKAYLNIPQQPDSASDSSSGSGDESSPSLPPSTEPSTVYANSPDLAFLTDRLIQDIKNNDITGVEQILSLRVNIDRANESNETPLGVAVEQGNEEVLELLLNATANVDARSAGGKTPLLIAIRKGHDRIAQILLDQGANCKVYSDEGLTCLHYATWPQTSAGLLRLLIAQVRRINIDIDIPTHDGTHRTPLMMLLKHFADDRDWEAKFNGLVEAGADVNRRDANDISPLRCAVTEGSTTAVRLLIEQRANLEDFSAVHPKNNAIKTELQRAYETRRRGSLASSRSRRSLWSWSLIRRVFSS